MQQKTTQPKVSAIQTLIAAQVVGKLTAIGAQFKIIMPDGSEYGTLEVAIPSTKRTRHRAPDSPPYGAYSAICNPVLQEMKVGDVATFDASLHGFNTQRFAGAISARAQSLWGNGGSQYMINPSTGLIEIIRLK